MRDKIIKVKLTKLSGICGVLASLVFFASILLAIYMSPRFRWTSNALSDLGVESGSLLFFNIGVILSGVLLFIFSLGLAKILTKKIGAYLLAVGSLAFIGIGLFPETLFIPHYIVSATFFVLLALSLLFIGITIMKEQYARNMGAAACVFSVLAFSSLVLLNFFDGVAIPEALSSFPAFVWCMTFGLKIAIQS